MENTQSILGILAVVRDVVVVLGLVGAAGLAVWMLPWSDADLDATRGDLRAVRSRLLGLPNTQASIGQVLERAAA